MPRHSTRPAPVDGCASIDHGPPHRDRRRPHRGRTQPGSWARAVAGRSAPARRPTVTSRHATAARSPPATLATEALPHRLRPGPDPVRPPRPALDQPRHAPHARSTGAQPPMWTAHAPLGGSRAAITSPSGAPISPDQPATRSGAAQVADRSARGQPAIASSSARAVRLRDPRHPPPPPPVSSRRGT